MDAAEIIDAIGPGTLATELGVVPGAVSNWKLGGIPARYWLAIARIAKRESKAVGLDDLEKHTFPGRPRAGRAA